MNVSAASALTDMMRKLLVVALLLAFTATAADARRRHHHGHWRAMTVVPMAPPAAEAGMAQRLAPLPPAERLVPRDWQLQPPDPNWQGRRYVSPGGHAWLAFYSSPADSQALAQHLKAVAFVEGEDITYLQRERDWLVVSGFKGDRIFYRKVVLGCDGRLWRHVAFEYPAEAKRTFDRFVTRISRGLTVAAGDECIGNAAAR